MFRTSIKAATTIVAAGLVVTTVFANLGMNTNADEVMNDSSIGISSAIDRYVETAGSDAADSTELANADATTEEATDGTTETTEDTTKVAETCKYPQFENRCLTTTTGNVNIRSEASAESEKVGTLPSGGIALVKEKGDEWTYIASGNCEGYIKNEFIAFGDDAGAYAETHLDKVAKVTATTLSVREEGNADSTCITLVPQGGTYTILSDDGDWLQVAVDDSTTGYISSEYAEKEFKVVRATTVAEEEAAEQAEKEAQEKAQADKEAKEKADQQAGGQTEAPSNDNESGSDNGSGSGSGSGSDNGSGSGSGSEAPAAPVDTSADGVQKGADLAAYAQQFVGNPYVYGGTSLTNGADCSGFTLALYALWGINLPHSANSQSYMGTAVDFSELIPGDLIFYADPDGTMGHVGIYIGNGQIVHASSRRTGIKISNYNYRTPVKARRLFS
mgnify:FL=1